MAKEIKHLKTTCDHCGCAIDPEIHSACPKCGAAYDRSKHVERYNELQDQMNQIKVDTAEAELESLKLDNARKRQQLQNNQNNRYHSEPIVKRKNYPLVIVLVIIGLLSIGFISASVGVINDVMGEINSERVTEATPAPIVETPTEVGFNESAELIQYSVICDKVEEYYYLYDKPQEGFRYLRMHLIITNKTDEDFYVWDSMKCTYMKGDYEINAEANTIHSSDLNTKIYRKNVPAHASAEGWVYFEVPADTNIKLYCGEYVTMNLSSYTVLDGEPLNEQHMQDSKEIPNTKRILIDIDCAYDEFYLMHDKDNFLPNSCNSVEVVTKEVAESNDRDMDATEDEENYKVGEGLSYYRELGDSGYYFRFM